MRGAPEERFWAKVERQSGDGCWLWIGSTNQKGYGQFGVNGSLVTVHRFSYELNVGPIPAGRQLDHRVTCPKRCVNPNHLRPVTNKQNSENLAGAQRNNSTGVRGVSWNQRDRKWQGKVRHNYKLIHVGYFDNIEAAERAVVAKRLELFTHNDVDRQAAS